ncbi:hypothetical protein K1720_00965 [Thermococcus argininiproducens]|uniref:Uncharacterized protein n=1 Tax=Thermococcus argininiproducens TaxID=2866384 RepID=A0A9E7MAC6_9EURY|nr:hypothetical protein [Thermococcus argininiproducens]USH00089.1 hypothetical protein K1720_00965 [Thermococcus argininiproducens]
MDDESSSSFWLSKILKSKRKESIIEQRITEDAYRDLRALLMRAKPEVVGNRVILKLPNGTVELTKDKLKVISDSREHAEKILRNLHHYSMPPGLWPAYGLSYSIRKGSLLKSRS